MSKKHALHNQAIIKKRLARTANRQGDNKIAKKGKTKQEKNLKDTAKQSIFDNEGPRLKTVGYFKESISEKEGQRQSKRGSLPKRKTERNLSLYAYQKAKYGVIKKRSNKPEALYKPNMIVLGEFKGPIKKR